MHENLHRDYQPLKVKGHIKSSIVGGIIIKMRFVKVKNMTILDVLKLLFFLGPYKDVYYWLPYKNIIDSTKYSSIGSAKRFPFANLWLEVRPTSEIYEQGLNDFVFHTKRIAKHSNEMRLALPFLSSELLTVTRKSVIRMLDEHLFTKTRQHVVRKINSSNK